MDILTSRVALASLITEDPFCAQEGVKTLESTGHHRRLRRIENDLLMHLAQQDLPYTLTSDLLIRDVPLKEGLAPDIALWPGRHVVAREEDCGSLRLSADLCPALVLEVASENTAETDRETKHEIYRLAEIEEYWLYDPMGYTGGPPFQGWRLTGLEYASIAAQSGRVAGQAVWLYPSAVLTTAWGLAQDIELRLRDPARDDWYWTARQERIHAQQAEVRAQQAEARAQQAEAQAHQAEAQAQQERTRAQQREERRQQEIQRLRAMLGEQADPD